MATRAQIVYWRDIPAQIRVRTGRQRTSQPLSGRFGVAIDEAAMVAGLTGADDYLAAWRNGAWQDVDGDAEPAAGALAAEIEASYPPARLRRLIAQGGAEA